MIELLEGWKDAWKYPDLWIELCANRIHSPLKLSDLLIKGYVFEVNNPNQAFEYLLEKGEFSAAEKMLFQTFDKENEFYEDCLLRLNEYRKREMSKLAFRHYILLKRATGLNPDWESQINELRPLLYRDPAESRAMIELVEQELDNNDEDIERKERDLNTEDNHEGSAWPYRDISSIELCHWFLDQEYRSKAPAPFKKNWLPPGNDMNAYSLIAQLKKLLESPADIDIDQVTKFMELLVLHFSGTPVNVADEEIKPKIMNGYWIINLDNCSCPWIPFLMDNEAKKLLIAILIPQDQSDILPLPPKGVITLDLSGKIMEAEDSVVIHPDTIFRGMRYKDHRKRFLEIVYEAGRQLHPAKIFPATSQKLSLLSTHNLNEIDRICIKVLHNSSNNILTHEESIYFLSMAIDIYTIRLENLIDIERIAYYGTCYSRILLKFLELLFISIGPREERTSLPVTQEMIEEIWDGTRFREFAYSFILNQLEDDLLLQFILGIYIKNELEPSEFADDSFLSIDGVICELDDSGIDIEDPTMNFGFTEQVSKKKLEILVSLALLEKADKGTEEKFRLNQQGLGDIVRDNIGRTINRHMKTIKEAIQSAI